MTVKQLKEILAGVADDVLVVKPAPDHEFRQLGVRSVNQTTALFKDT